MTEQSVAKTTKKVVGAKELGKSLDKFASKFGDATDNFNYVSVYSEQFKKTILMPSKSASILMYIHTLKIISNAPHEMYPFKVQLVNRDGKEVHSEVLKLTTPGRANTAYENAIKKRMDNIFEIMKAGCEQIERRNTFEVEQQR